MKPDPKLKMLLAVNRMEKKLDHLQKDFFDTNFHYRQAEERRKRKMQNIMARLFCFFRKLKRWMTSKPK